MDGVFMKKIIKRLGVCAMITLLIWFGSVLADRNMLREELIRLHVVANSDSPEDQARKLRVRDTITQRVASDLTNISDVQQAKAYLQDKLPVIQKAAEDTLRALGCEDTVSVSLCREAFDIRFYETFTLPAGVYNSLRIVIGEGQGKNWWCVVFPEFCIPSDIDEFKDVAAGAGFPDSLNRSLTEETGYELRFYMLDMLGKLENILFTG